MSITVASERCVGCRLCELACSFSRCRQFDPQQAAIRITFENDGAVSIDITEACASCRHALCAAFCPAGAITGTTK